MALKPNEGNFSEDVLVNHFFSDIQYLVESSVLKKRMGFKTTKANFDHIREDLVLIDDGDSVNSFNISDRIDFFTS